MSWGSWVFSAERLAGRMAGLPWPAVALVLVVAYVALHYLFVSQTAHLLALFGVFLGVGVKLGVPASLLAFQLLFATNTSRRSRRRGRARTSCSPEAGTSRPPELYRLGV